MGAKAFNAVVALDGGTTNTRARLLRDGVVVATARRGVGVRDAVVSRAAPSLATAVAEVIREVLGRAGVDRPNAIVASGMLSSEVGLAAVPHVEAPAGLDELARAVQEFSRRDVSEWPIQIIPGVRTPAAAGPDGWAVADVMRGEECETIGILETGRFKGPAALLWPGSHAKLVEIDGEGRIVRGTTTLAGEIASTLARHTLIAASLPETLPDRPEPAAAAAGVRLGRSEGLGRAAFLARIAAITGALTLEQRGAFWIGAVVGDDAAHLARHPILGRGLPLIIGGREPLRTLYAQALRDALPETAVATLDDHDAENAAAMGALAVVRRRQALGLDGP